MRLETSPTKKPNVILRLLETQSVRLSATQKIHDYIALMKPRLISLLIFTSLGAMFVAARPDPLSFPAPLWLLSAIAITAGTGGCNVLTSYLDRDIDAKMERTKHRPIPSGRITPPNALIWGVMLVGSALALALTRNFLAFLFLLLGVIDNVIVYSAWLKRRNPLNIILGGFSGGFPALYGWAYVANSVNLTAILLAAVVILWIPYHIWNLAIYFRDDYARAGVPMLPVVVDMRKAIHCIVSTIPLLLGTTILLYFVGEFGLLFLIMGVGMGVVALIGNLTLLRSPTREKAFKLFRISSPHLFLLYLAMIIESVHPLTA